MGNIFKSKYTLFLVVVLIAATLGVIVSVGSKDDLSGGFSYQDKSKMMGKIVADCSTLRTPKQRRDCESEKADARASAKKTCDPNAIPIFYYACSTAKNLACVLLIKIGENIPECQLADVATPVPQPPSGSIKMLSKIFDKYPIPKIKIPIKW